MTDSMKFGPEWLRNLSTDSSASIGLGNSISSTTSVGCNSTTNSGGTNNNHTSNVNINHGSSTASSVPRNMFPEFRYGREEMLSLFDKNCNMPEILPLYKKICVEKVQIPLALTPSTEDEIIQNSQVPTQRPLWMQRSPLGFSSSGRGISRGGSVERGRMRGKPMYTTFQRAPAVFEEEPRPGLLKPERGWYERNGSGDTSVGTSSSCGNSGIGSGSDWNGGGTPHTSPRREFSNHSRNMENWRRNRTDDGAGEPTTEGWRNSSSTHIFGGIPRWARSTSWRDEDGAPNEVQGVSANNSSNIVQRSFSTISTTLTSGNSAMPKNSNEKHFTKIGPPSGTTQTNKNNQWAAENSTSRLQDGEDNLPEWATDIPLEGGGSFDATGAFLGSATEDGRDTNDCRDKNQKDESEDSTPVESSSEHASKSDYNLDQTLSTEQKEIQKKPLRDCDGSFSKMNIEHSKENSSSSLENDKMKSVPTVMDSAFSTQVPQSNQSSQPGQRRLSDHMIEAADDMVKKLINDDDVSDIEKSDNGAPTFISANSNSMKTVSSLEQSLLASQNISHAINPNNNTIGVAPGHKGMFFYGNMEQPQVQPPLQHQFHPANIIHNEVSSMATHSGSELWYYRDPQSKVQGPFAALEMTEWYRAGYFNENLLVRRACDTRFRALGDLIKTSQNNMPFTHSTLLGTINMEAVPMMQQQKEQCDELKGNVTAAADTLSAAVKNMSSVDMLHMLNVHFQLLQEQYIRRQEMTILSELAKNEAFHRLSPAERDTIVRQKAQINGLPDYLTSLTNLGNTLVTLNPSAGTQLFNAILECSKKDNQQQIFPQSTLLSSNYMDVGEFILNMQRQQPQCHIQPHQSQHQQQQQQQQQQQLPCQAQSQFTGFEGNVGPESLLGNGILEDLNIRMLLSGNNTHPPQSSLVQHLAPKAPAPQDLVSNTHGGGFLTEQQILASSAAVSGNTSQSPLLQMWLPSTASNILGTQHSPQVQNQQVPQQPQQNQWTAGGSLVGIPNVIAAENSPSEQQLDVSPSSKAPNSMWTNIKSPPQNNDSVNVEGKGKLVDCEQKRFLEEELPSYETKIDSGTTLTTSSTNSQNQNLEEMFQQSSAKPNRNEENNQGVEKQVQQSLKKQKQSGVPALAGVNQKFKDDFKKVDSEEKRRQKEERKRQQMEDEKKRLQQLEQERRRQLQEEEDRQKQIQAQRRKALLGSGNDNGNSSTTQKSYKEPKASVAPWSAQSITTSSTSGPCLAEIQKAERRERRADQQRQLELMEKQVRLNTALALEANEAIPKWHASPVQAKSIAEIQAEEAKKLNAESIFDAQRRKDIELQAAINMVNVSSSATANVPCLTYTWNSLSQNKFWGSNNVASNNTIASGFWEEPAKHKTNGSSAGSFAAAISSGKPQNSNPSTSTVVSSSRNLKKSQTVSVMQSTTNASASKNSKGSINNSQQTQSITAPSKQANNNKAVNTEKKGASSSKNNNNGNIGSNPSISKDEFENEFINWCMKSLNNMNTKVDVPTFVTFLRDLESPYEVKDYVRIYLGESKEFNDFAKQFLERRSKYKNLQRAQNAHNDDMCKPAPAITPSAGNDNTDSKNKQKKLKKNKMTKLDARILGFSVTAAEGRINVGDRDYVDAP